MPDKFKNLKFILVLFFFIPINSIALEKCNNKFHKCFGKYTFKSGNKYVGEFLNNTPNGNGTKFYKYGDKYEGNWRNGSRNGKGIYFHKNGTKYIGEYKNDFEDGKGVYFYNNGDIFVGEFKRGMRTGKGIYIRKNGEKIEGIFKFNKIITHKKVKFNIQQQKIIDEYLQKNKITLRNKSIMKTKNKKESLNFYSHIVSKKEYHSIKYGNWKKSHPAIKFISTNSYIYIGTAFANNKRTHWRHKPNFKAVENASLCKSKVAYSVKESLHMGKVEKVIIDYNKVNFSSQHHKSYGNTEAFVFNCKSSCQSVYGYGDFMEPIKWRHYNKLTIRFQKEGNMKSSLKKALNDLSKTCNKSQSIY
jgi:hypothetical protein